MDPGKITQNHRKGVCFLDLPELIFRKIFRNLEDHRVYLVLSNICHKIRKYVESYIKLCGIFVDVSLHKNFNTRKFCVFKRYDNTFSIHFFLKYLCQSKLEWVDFGAFVDGKIVLGKCVSIGEYCCELPGVFED